MEISIRYSTKCNLRYAEINTFSGLVGKHDGQIAEYNFLFLSEAKHSPIPDVVLMYLYTWDLKWACVEYVEQK